MKAVEIYTLRRTESTEDGVASLLYRNGIATGLIVPGCVLEAQFSGPMGALLFTTHDIPFEERLDITLLNEASEIVDRASLWGTLATGSFRDMSATDPDSVTFNFFGGHRWRVRVLARASFCVPIPGWEPIGVHRPFGWMRRFIVEAAP